MEINWVEPPEITKKSPRFSDLDEGELFMVVNDDKIRRKSGPAQYVCQGTGLQWIVERESNVLMDSSVRRLSGKLTVWETPSDG